MSKSLQDQLLGAGLIDKKKAKKINKQASKEASQKRRAKDDSPDEAQLELLRAREEKKEKDRDLNLKRKAEADKKAVLAQVIQLIEHYKVAGRAGDIEFNFTDGKRIKKLLLNKDAFEKVSYGTFSIARINDRYELIPRPIAEKIQQREPTFIVLDNYQKRSEKEQQEDDDYYADFEIPDDLMW